MTVTWAALTQLSWAALRCSWCLPRSEAVIGAAQDLLQLIDSSTDERTSWSLVHTTPPPPSGKKVKVHNRQFFLMTKKDIVFFFSQNNFILPLLESGGLDAAAEAVFLSGLLLVSLWDRRSGTRGLDGPDSLRSPGSLQNTSSINIL